MKQVEVKILQQSYMLACKEGQEERLIEAVRLVDDAMTRIHDAGKVRARERIAVLAALNLAYELGDMQRHAAVAPRSAVLAGEPVDHAVERQVPLLTENDSNALLQAQNQALQQIVEQLDDLLAAESPRISPELQPVVGLAVSQPEVG